MYSIEEGFFQKTNENIRWPLLKCRNWLKRACNKKFKKYIYFNNILTINKISR